MLSNCTLKNILNNSEKYFHIVKLMKLAIFHFPLQEGETVENLAKRDQTLAGRLNNGKAPANPIFKYAHALRKHSFLGSFKLQEKVELTKSDHSFPA